MRQFMRVFIPILLLLLLLGYGIYHIYNQNKEVRETKSLLSQYQQRLEDTEADYAELEANNSELSERNVILQDSVTLLRKRVLELRSILRDKVGVIENNKGEIARMQREMQNLLSQITNLRNEKSQDLTRLKELENERFALDKRIGQLFMQNDTLENENSALLVELVKTEKEKENVQDQLVDTKTTLAGVTGEGPYEVEGKKGVRININAIDAEFDMVEARTRKDKLARSARKWRNTKIEFDLIYPNLESLFNQNFSVQMVNEETGELMSPRESSDGAYDAKGVGFAFTGNPVRVDFVNYEDKKDLGTDYTVRLFFIDGTGKEIPLSTSVAPVIFKR